ncbi:MAG: quinol monooxygenase YgiN [Psychromonas sp.]|jgi:quinol monooxygenase YgiN|uniref:putative quinol monooxygenase n=1 Tax=Psychromonas sp. TaxID=1884585 RepID=UPI0039E7034D
MNTLTIVANIIAKEDKIDLIKTELIKLIDITLAEKGCLNYDLHQDNENPAHFVFYEKWATRELWQAHMDGKHLQDFVSNTEDALAKFSVNEMTRIA